MIQSVDSLRQLYAPPKGRALQKQLTRLDRHCRRFIELSPFVVVASVSEDGHLDASPRGGKPGFVKVVNETTLWIPDAPGNNRLDTLTNIVKTQRIGLLFLIPGVDETLRVNGAARVSADDEQTRQLADEERIPKVLIEVTVEEAYLHCAKALMRSNLWSEESRQDRSVLPTMAEMLRDQIGDDGPTESQEQMVARYMKEL